MHPTPPPRSATPFPPARLSLYLALAGALLGLLLGQASDAAGATDQPSQRPHASRPA